jgi:uncharacterized protein YuzE
MLVEYNTKTDLLYIRLDDRPQDVMNRPVSDDIVLDIGAEGHIVGIEILDASRRVNLQQLLPVECRVSPEAAS